MRKIPQIKICGLTRSDEAIECARLGADAIGLVFYPASPRNLSRQKAKEISLALPSEVTTVGVFVNETFSNIMEIVQYCKLKAVQLHGDESPKLVNKLRKENIIVIKALFTNKKPFLKDISDYNASAYLVECGKGILPGGNAEAWNWEEAREAGMKYPLILAGGIDRNNVSKAVAAGLPDAVDISSGVEFYPGRKDPEKVKSFIKAVSECNLPGKTRKIF